MIGLSDKYKISSGNGFGEYRITSFDDALLNAGVGNYNLVRLSSILPLGANQEEDIHLPLGSLLPIAYAVESTNIPCRRIAAAVAIGFPAKKDSEHCAVIMEYEGECSKEEAIAVVTKMVEEGFAKRNWELEKIEVKATDVIGPMDGSWVTAFACVAEWDGYQ